MLPPVKPPLGLGITEPLLDPRELEDGGADGGETCDRPELWGGGLIEGREETLPPEEGGEPRLLPPD